MKKLNLFVHRISFGFPKDPPKKVALSLHKDLNEKDRKHRLLKVDLNPRPRAKLKDIIKKIQINELLLGG